MMMGELPVPIAPFHIGMPAAFPYPNILPSYQQTYPAYSQHVSPHKSHNIPSYAKGLLIYDPKFEKKGSHFNEKRSCVGCKNDDWHLPIYFQQFFF